MVLRCSNGVAFLVLEPEPSIRTGIRVDIYEGDNPLSLIARLPLTWGRRWTDPLKGTGSGEFWLHAHDETLAANPGLLAYGNIARFSLDEVYRFAIQIEHLDRVQVRGGGDVERTIKVTGRGVLSKLEEAVLYPAGGLAGDPSREFTDANADDVLGLAFDEAQARNALPGLARDFTAAADSNNAPYDVTLTLDEKAGTSVLRIAERFAELAGDVYMTPAGVLRFVNQRGVDRSQQLVNAGPVKLTPADNLAELTRSEDGAVRNVLLVETPAGYLERSEGGSVTEFGRREAFLALGNITDGDAVDRAADSIFTESASPAAQIGASVTDKEGARPYVDWGVGDWVLAPDENDAEERHRVRAITVSETAEGQPVFTPELATITEELEARLERWLAAMAKGTVGGTASGVAEPLTPTPGEVGQAIDAGIADHVAIQPHFDELADLADVDPTSWTGGDLLYYDGSDWRRVDGTPNLNDVPVNDGAGGVAWGAGGGSAGGEWLDAKATTDTPDDDFSASTLAAKWTAVAGSASPVGLLSATGGKYDLTTTPGRLLAQVAGGSNVFLRQDYTLPDGASIVLKCWPALMLDAASPGGQAASDTIVGLVINDDDASPNNGGTGVRLSLWLQVTGTTGARLVWFNGGTELVGSQNVNNGILSVPHYLRIARSGTTYYPFVSQGGRAWSPLAGPVAAGAARSNIWLYIRGDNAMTVAPIHAIDWVRQGSNNYEPW